MKNGYSRVSKVVENGEYAVRGSIIDLYPSGAADGVRIDFFGDEVESIREFDPLTQISAGEIRSFKLLPASEIIWDVESIELFRSNYRKTFGAVVKEDFLYEAISAGQKYAGQENWLPLFYDGLCTIFDYLPNASITCGHLFEQSFAERVELIHDYYNARKGTDYKALPPDALYNLSLDQNIGVISQFGEGKPVFKPLLGQNFSGADGLERIKNFSKTVYISCFSQGSLEHIKTLLKKHDIESTQMHQWKIKNHKSEIINLIIAPIEEGFENDNFILIAESDIFGDRFARTVKKKRKAENFLAEAVTMEINEPVVHENHGIGRFMGLETLEVSGKQHAMAKLIYEGEIGYLFPLKTWMLLLGLVANIENLKLDKLGGVQWQERKARLKERIKLAADKLLKIAAARALKVAAKFMPESGLYDEFVAKFPFTETDDQLRSIDDVFADLASGKPMDRLICGDVGFGKTEVALRAAFLVVGGKI